MRHPSYDVQYGMRSSHETRYVCCTGLVTKVCKNDDVILRQFRLSSLLADFDRFFLKSMVNLHIDFDFHFFIVQNSKITQVYEIKRGLKTRAKFINKNKQNNRTANKKLTHTHVSDPHIHYWMCSRSNYPTTFI